jgi:hypothetical protein
MGLVDEPPSVAGSAMANARSCPRRQFCDLVAMECSSPPNKKASSKYVGRNRLAGSVYCTEASAGETVG